MTPINATATAQVGVIGLAGVGKSLARSFASHGHAVALLDRTGLPAEALVGSDGAMATFLPSATVEAFVRTLERPRRIILTVQAGARTDATIDALAPHLEAGDIVVDCGNANYEDSRRRGAALKALGLHFVGAGISGGEGSRLRGPSIMPGGSAESYAALGPLLEDICARVDGQPCCAYLGPDGAGHFVKMVHDGIAYAALQFIAEGYDLLRGAGMGATQIADVFREWNAGDLESQLIEMAAEIIEQIDAGTGRPLVDVIVDHAEQNSTGRWTVHSALELGAPVNAIAEAVFSQFAPRRVRLRNAARAALTGPQNGTVDDVEQLISDVRAGLWSAMVVAYAQGLDQIQAANSAYAWSVDLGDVARIWRGGCVIPARLLEKVRHDYAGEALDTLLAAPRISEELGRCQDGWRRVLVHATRSGIPAPGLASALAYYDTVRAEQLPAALVQGIRDLLGAHTSCRVDRQVH